MPANASTTKTAAPPQPAPERTPRGAGRMITERDAASDALSWKDELALLFPPR